MWLRMANSGQVVLQAPTSNDHVILMTINDVLVEVLGQDLALAVRLCVDTRAAMDYPLGYAVALEEMLGGQRAIEVVAHLEDRLRAQVGDLPATKWMHLPELVRCLRTSYSGSVLLSMK